MTILVVASQVDEVAQYVASALPHDSARLLTCADLSRSGWAVGTDIGTAATCVASGEVLATSEIGGVLILMPYVFEQELVHILPDDRSYVAAEMTAFLLYWLSSLTCQKLNPPTAGCLSGPNWRPEQWVVAAHEAGLPVKPVRRSTTPDAEAPPNEGQHSSVTLIGKQCLGDGHKLLRRQAQSLAAVAAVDMVQVDFIEENGFHYFVGANTFPDLRQPEAIDALWRFYSS